LSKISRKILNKYLNASLRYDHLAISLISHA